MALGRRLHRGRRAPTSRARPAAAGGAVSALSDDEIHKILAARRRRASATTTRAPTGSATSSTSSASPSTTRRTAGTRRTAARATSSRSPASTRRSRRRRRLRRRCPRRTARRRTTRAAGLGGRRRRRRRAAGADAKGDSKRVLPEKARRELAKKLREITGASARLCEKALQSHSDDMERAADWLLNERDAGRDADTNGAWRRAHARAPHTPTCPREKAAPAGSGGRRAAAACVCER